MKILVKAKTKAKNNKVERIDQPTIDFGIKKNELIIYKVTVKEAPINGKANKAIIRELANYFNINISKVILLSGQRSKQKIFEIGD